MWDLKKKVPLLVLPIICLVMLLHALNYMVMVDDSFIAFRYAENLADGNGLVFNPGEKVEGYTDFLWVIMLSFFYTLGFSTPLVAQVLGITAAIVVLPLLYVAGRRCCNLPRWLSLLICFTVAATGSVAMWAGSGLETTLYMSLITAALFFFVIEIKKVRLLPLPGILFAVATLTRPEGAGMFTVSIVVAVLLRSVPFKSVLKNVIAFFLIVVPHAIFRIMYYGSPLPNTFYAKDGPFMIFIAKGLKYSLEFLLTHGAWIFVLLLLLPFFSSRQQRKLLFIPLVVLFFASTYITYVGGDFMLYSRFYVPYVPWFFLLTFSGAWYVGLFLAKGRGGFFQSVPVLLVAIVTMSILITSNYYADRKYKVEYSSMFDILRVRKEFGLWLRNKYPSDTLLAVSALGVVPYYSKMRSIDMVGLADKHIAHLKMKPSNYDQVIAHIKYDSDYILSRKPDLVPILTKFYLDYETVDTGMIINDAMTFGWNAPSDLIWKREFRLNYAPRLAQLKSNAQVAYFERIQTLTDWRVLAAQGVKSPEVYLRLADSYTRHFLLIEAADAREYARKLQKENQD